jgi:hypothetical protein
VFVGAVGSRIDEMKGNQLFFLSFLEEGSGEKGAEDFGEERDDVEVH